MSQSLPGCYYVLLTNFCDDYKPRWGSWSEHEGPYLFATKEAADKFLRRAWIKFLDDEDYFYDEHPNLWEKGQDGKWILKDETQLEDIVREQAKGEYVDPTFEWSTGYLNIYPTDDIPPERDASEEDEEEEKEAEPPLKRTKTEEENPQ